MTKTFSVIILLYCVFLLQGCSSTRRDPFEFIKRLKQQAKVEFSMAPTVKDTAVSRFVVVAFDEQGKDFSRYMTREIRKKTLCEVIPYDSLINNRPSTEADFHFRDSAQNGNALPKTTTYDSVAATVFAKGFTTMLWLMVEKDTSYTKVSHSTYSTGGGSYYDRTSRSWVSMPTHTTSYTADSSNYWDKSILSIFLLLPSNAFHARVHYNGTPIDCYQTIIEEYIKQGILKPR